MKPPEGYCHECWEIGVCAPLKSPTCLHTFPGWDEHFRDLGRKRAVNFEKDSKGQYWEVYKQLDQTDPTA